MYFRNYRLSKTCLEKKQTSPAPEYPSTVNMSKRPNTYEICMRPRLSYLLITLIVTDLENIDISHMLTLRTLP